MNDRVARDVRVGRGAADAREQAHDKAGAAGRTRRGDGRDAVRSAATVTCAEMLEPRLLLTETALSAVATSGRSVRLMWPALPAGVDQIEVERDAGAGFTLVATLPRGTTQFEDAAGLEPGTWYAYRIRGRQPGSNFVAGTSADARTWAWGDANGDGRVDVRDYFATDRGRATGLSGWANGDFDGDGIVTGNDYLAIDAAFLGSAAFAGAARGSKLRGEAKAVAVDEAPAANGDLTAYVATGSHGLAAVKVSRAGDVSLLGQSDLPGDATDVAIDGRRGIAAVAAGDGGLLLVDVSDPTRPTLRKRLGVHAAQVEVRDGVVYGAVGAEVRSYDLLSGDALGMLAPGGAVITGLSIAGGHLYTLDAAGTFRSVSLPGGGTMNALAALSLPAAGALWAGEGVAYAGSATGAGGLAVVDLTVPGSPRLLSGPGGVAGRAAAADGLGRAVSVGSAPGVEGGVLDVVDAADPGRLLARVALPDDALGVAVAGGLALVAAGEAGLQVVDYAAQLEGGGAAPVVTIAAAPASGIGAAALTAVEGRRTPLRVVIQSDAGVRQVDYLINGQVVATETSYPYTTEPELPLLSSGATTAGLQVSVTDTRGRTALSQTIQFDLLPDTRPPTVEATDPTPGAVVGKGFRTVGVLFSEPLDAATVSAANFRLVNVATGADLAAASVILAGEGDQAQRLVRMSFDSLPAGQYRLVINASAVRDRAGNALGAADFTRTFTKIDYTNWWVNPAGGAWGDGANWSRGEAPGPADDVLVAGAAAGGAYTVTLDADATVRSFTMDAAGATLSARGRTLTVNGPSLVAAGTVRWFNSTWAGSETLTNRGTLIFEGDGTARQTVIGVPLVQGATGTTLILGVKGLLPDGTVVNLNPVAKVVGGVTNAGRVELWAEGAGAPAVRLVVEGGPLVNAPGGLLLFQQSNVPYELAAELDNRGAVDVRGVVSLGTPGVSHRNAGTVAVAAGATLTLTRQQTFTQDDGTLSVTAGGFAGVNEASTFALAGGALANQGTFALADGATFDFRGGTATGERVLLTNAGLLVRATATRPAHFALRERSTLEGGLAAGQSVTIEGFGPDGSARRDAAVTIRGIGFANAGTITLRVVSSVQARADLLAPTGTLVNLPTGRIETGGTGQGIALAAEIDNRGTLVADVPTFVGRPGARHRNTGTIRIGLAGYLEVSSGSESFTMAGGALADESSRGEGSFVVRGGSFRFLGGAVSGKPLLLDDSALHVSPDATGAFHAVLEGENVLSGTLAPGQVVEVRAYRLGEGYRDARVTVAGDGFVNGGTIRLWTISHDPRTLAELSVPQGVLVNLPTGRIESGSPISTHQPVNVLAEVDNRGTIFSLQKIVLGKDGAHHRNSGKITNYAGSFDVRGAAMLNEAGGLVAGPMTFFVPLTNAGTLEPGGSGFAGSMTVAGDFVQTATGTVRVDVAGPAPVSGHDRFVVTGAATLAGTASPRLVGDYVPPAGTSLAFMAFASRAGEIAAGDGDPFDDAVFEVTNADTFASIAVAAPVDSTVTAVVAKLKEGLEAVLADLPEWASALNLALANFSGAGVPRLDVPLLTDAIDELTSLRARLAGAGVPSIAEGGVRWAQVVPRLQALGLEVLNVAGGFQLTPESPAGQFINLRWRKELGEAAVSGGAALGGDAPGALGGLASGLGLNGGFAGTVRPTIDLSMGVDEQGFYLLRQGVLAVRLTGGGQVGGTGTVAGAATAMGGTAVVDLTLMAYPRPGAAPLRLADVRAGLQRLLVPAAEGSVRLDASFSAGPAEVTWSGRWDLHEQPDRSTRVTLGSASAVARLTLPGLSTEGGDGSLAPAQLTLSGRAAGGLTRFDLAASTAARYHWAGLAVDNIAFTLNVGPDSFDGTGAADFKLELQGLDQPVTARASIGVDAGSYSVGGSVVVPEVRVRREATTLLRLDRVVVNVGFGGAAGSGATAPAAGAASVSVRTAVVAPLAGDAPAAPAGVVVGRQLSGVVASDGRVTLRAASFTVPSAAGLALSATGLDVILAREVRPEDALARLGGLRVVAPSLGGAQLTAEARDVVVNGSGHLAIGSITLSQPTLTVGRAGGVTVLRLDAPVVSVTDLRVGPDALGRLVFGPASLELRAAGAALFPGQAYNARLEDDAPGDALPAVVGRLDFTTDRVELSAQRFAVKLGPLLDLNASAVGAEPAVRLAYAPAGPATDPVLSVASMEVAVPALARRGRTPVARVESLKVDHAGRWSLARARVVFPQGYTDALPILGVLPAELRQAELRFPDPSDLSRYTVVATAALRPDRMPAALPGLKVYLGDPTFIGSGGPGIRDLTAGDEFEVGLHVDSLPTGAVRLAELPPITLDFNRHASLPGLHGGTADVAVRMSFGGFDEHATPKNLPGTETFGRGTARVTGVTGGGFELVNAGGTASASFEPSADPAEAAMGLGRLALSVSLSAGGAAPSGGIAGTASGTFSVNLRAERDPDAASVTGVRVVAQATLDRVGLSNVVIRVPAGASDEDALVKLTLGEARAVTNPDPADPEAPTAEFHDVRVEFPRFSHWSWRSVAGGIEQVSVGSVKVYDRAAVRRIEVRGLSIGINGKITGEGGTSMVEFENLRVILDFAVGYAQDNGVIGGLSLLQGPDYPRSVEVRADKAKLLPGFEGVADALVSSERLPTEGEMADAASAAQQEGVGGGGGSGVGGGALSPGFPVNLGGSRGPVEGGFVGRIDLASGALVVVGARVTATLRNVVRFTAANAVFRVDPRDLTAPWLILGGPPLGGAKVEALPLRDAENQPLAAKVYTMTLGYTGLRVGAAVLDAGSWSVPLGQRLRLGPILDVAAGDLEVRLGEIRVDPIGRKASVGSLTFQAKSAKLLPWGQAAPTRVIELSEHQAAADGPTDPGFKLTFDFADASIAASVGKLHAQFGKVFDVVAIKPTVTVQIDDLIADRRVFANREGLLAALPQATVTIPALPGFQVTLTGLGLRRDGKLRLESVAVALPPLPGIVGRRFAIAGYVPVELKSVSATFPDPENLDEVALAAVVEPRLQAAFGAYAPQLYVGDPRRIGAETDPLAPLPAGGTIPINLHADSLSRGMFRLVNMEPLTLKLADLTAPFPVSLGGSAKFKGQFSVGGFSADGMLLDVPGTEDPVRGRFEVTATNASGSLTLGAVAEAGGVLELDGDRPADVIDERALHGTGGLTLNGSLTLSGGGGGAGGSGTIGFQLGLTSSFSASADGRDVSVSVLSRLNEASFNDLVLVLPPPSSTPQSDPPPVLRISLGRARTALNNPTNDPNEPTDEFEKLSVEFPRFAAWGWPGAAVEFGAATVSSVKLYRNATPPRLEIDGAVLAINSARVGGATRLAELPGLKLRLDLKLSVTFDAAGGIASLAVLPGSRVSVEAASASILPGHALFTASASNVAGSIDLTSGRMTLAAPSVAVKVRDFAHVTATDMTFTFDPLDASADAELARVASVKVELPRLKPAPDARPVTLTATHLAFRRNGFDVGSAQAMLPDGLVKFGDLFDMTGVSATLSGIRFTLPDASLAADALTLSSDAVRIAPGGAFASLTAEAAGGVPGLRLTFDFATGTFTADSGKVKARAGGLLNVEVTRPTFTLKASDLDGLDPGDPTPIFSAALASATVEGLDGVEARLTGFALARDLRLTFASAEFLTGGVDDALGVAGVLPFDLQRVAFVGDFDRDGVRDPGETWDLSNFVLEVEGRFSDTLFDKSILPFTPILRIGRPEDGSLREISRGGDPSFLLRLKVIDGRPSFDDVGPFTLGFDDLRVGPLTFGGEITLPRYVNGAFEPVVAGRLRIAAGATEVKRVTGVGPDGRAAEEDFGDGSIALAGRMSLLADGAVRLDVSGRLGLSFSVGDAAMRLTNGVLDFGLSLTAARSETAGVELRSASARLETFRAQEMSVKFGDLMRFRATNVAIDFQAPLGRPIVQFGEVPDGDDDPSTKRGGVEVLFGIPGEAQFDGWGGTVGNFGIGRDFKLYLLPGFFVELKLPPNKSLGLDFLPVEVTKVGLAFKHAAEIDLSNPDEPVKIAGARRVTSLVPEDFELTLSAGIKQPIQGLPLEAGFSFHDLKVDLGKVRRGEFAITNLGGVSAGVDKFQVGPLQVAGRLGLGMVELETTPRVRVLYFHLLGEFQYDGIGFGMELVMTQYGPLMGRMLVGIPIPVSTIAGAAIGSVVPGVGTAAGQAVGEALGIYLTGLTVGLEFGGEPLPHVSEPEHLVEVGRGFLRRGAYDASEAGIRKAFAIIGPEIAAALAAGRPPIVENTWLRGYKAFASGRLTSLRLNGAVSGDVTFGFNLGFNVDAIKQVTRGQGLPLPEDASPVGAQMYGIGTLNVMGMPLTDAGVLLDFAKPAAPALNVAARLPAQGGLFASILPGYGTVGFRIDSEGLTNAPILTAHALLSAVLDEGAQFGKELFGRAMARAAAALDAERAQAVADIAATPARRGEVVARLRRLVRLLLDVNLDDALTDAELSRPLTADFIKARVLTGLQGVPALLPGLDAVAGLASSPDPTGATVKALRVAAEAGSGLADAMVQATIALLEAEGGTAQELLARYLPGLPLPPAPPSPLPPLPPLRSSDLALLGLAKLTADAALRMIDRLAAESPGAVERFYALIDPSITLRGRLQLAILGMPIGDPTTEAEARLDKEGLAVKVKGLSLANNVAAPLLDEVPIIPDVKLDGTLSLPLFCNAVHLVAAFLRGEAGQVPVIDHLSRDWFASLTGRMTLGGQDVANVTAVVLPPKFGDPGPEPACVQGTRPTFECVVQKLWTEPADTPLDPARIPIASQAQYDNVRRYGGIVLSGILRLPKWLSDPVSLWDQAAHGQLRPPASLSDPQAVMAWVNAVRAYLDTASSFDDFGRVQLYLPSMEGIIARIAAADVDPAAPPPSMFRLRPDLAIDSPAVQQILNAAFVEGVWDGKFLSFPIARGTVRGDRNGLTLETTDPFFGQRLTVEVGKRAVSYVDPLDPAAPPRTFDAPVARAMLTIGDEQLVDRATTDLLQRLGLAFLKPPLDPASQVKLALYSPLYGEAGDLEKLGGLRIDGTLGLGDLIRSARVEVRAPLLGGDLNAPGGLLPEFLAKLAVDRFTLPGDALPSVPGVTPPSLEIEGFLLELRRLRAGGPLAGRLTGRLRVRGLQLDLPVDRPLAGSSSGVWGRLDLGSLSYQGADFRLTGALFLDMNTGPGARVVGDATLPPGMRLYVKQGLLEARGARIAGDFALTFSEAGMDVALVNATASFAAGGKSLVSAAAAGVLRLGPGGLAGRLDLGLLPAGNTLADFGFSLGGTLSLTVNTSAAEALVPAPGGMPDVVVPAGPFARFTLANAIIGFGDAVEVRGSVEIEARAQEASLSFNGSLAVLSATAPGSPALFQSTSASGSLRVRGDGLVGVASFGLALESDGLDPARLRLAGALGLAVNTRPVADAEYALPARSLRVALSNGTLAYDQFSLAAVSATVDVSSSGVAISGLGGTLGFGGRSFDLAAPAGTALELLTSGKIFSLRGQVPLAPPSGGRTLAFGPFTLRNPTGTVSFGPTPAENGLTLDTELQLPGFLRPLTLHGAFAGDGSADLSVDLSPTNGLQLGPEGSGFSPLFLAGQLRLTHGAGKTELRLRGGAIGWSSIFGSQAFLLGDADVPIPASGAFTLTTPATDVYFPPLPPGSPPSANRDDKLWMRLPGLQATVNPAAGSFALGFGLAGGSIEVNVPQLASGDGRRLTVTAFSLRHDQVGPFEVELAQADLGVGAIRISGRVSLARTIREEPFRPPVTVYSIKVQDAALTVGNVDAVAFPLIEVGSDGSIKGAAATQDLGRAGGLRLRGLTMKVSGSPGQPLQLEIGGGPSLELPGGNFLPLPTATAGPLPPIGGQGTLRYEITAPTFSMGPAISVTGAAAFVLTLETGNGGLQLNLDNGPGKPLPTLSVAGGIGTLQLRDLKVASAGAPARFSVGGTVAGSLQLGSLTTADATWGLGIDEGVVRIDVASSMSLGDAASIAVSGHVKSDGSFRLAGQAAFNLFEFVAGVWNPFAGFGQVTASVALTREAAGADALFSGSVQVSGGQTFILNDDGTFSDGTRTYKLSR